MNALYRALRTHTTGPVHWLKCDPEPFAAVADRSKRFDLRVNDRDYRVGDLLVLQEHDRHGDAHGVYSGNWALVRVLYVMAGYVEGPSYGLEPGYAALSIELLTTGREESPHWPAGAMLRQQIGTGS